MSNVVEAVADKPGLCYGCGACMNACSAGAIKIKPDGSGFLRPVVDVGLCLECGACEDVCPRLHADYSNETPGKCLAVMAEDSVRQKSSTGGVFTLLAKYVLDRGGIVFGAALSDDFLVRHVGVESERDLARLRGSKYAQSDTGATYREAKAALDAGRHVLYCGCPCQIAGLKAFLGKDYDNLLMVDLLCGGNPSAYSLREYLDKTWGLGNIGLVRFRNMAGWDYRFEVFLRSGEIAMDPSNAYMRMYLAHALNKPACDSCQFGRLPRQGDVTIGDFWNVRTLDQDMDDGKGTSVVLLNNGKGRQIWDSVQLKDIRKSKEFTVDEAYRSGVWYIKTCPAPYAKRSIFDQLREKRGFTDAVRLSADHYDVGIAGTWLSNYGTISTNWALYNIVKSFGLSACLLDVTGNQLLDGRDVIPGMFIAAKGIPRASAFCKAGDYAVLNDHCDMFAVSSDQLWGPIELYMDLDEYVHLGFADDGKKLVAAGTALGTPDIPYDDKRLANRRAWLSRFLYIGVREDFAPGVLKDTYGVEADHIQDPVLLCDSKFFLQETKNATFVPVGKFVFAYMIYAEPDGPELRLAKEFARARGCGLVVSQGMGWDIIEYDVDLNLIGRHETYYRNWMRCMADADFVLTSSFHGACMSLVFRKDFAVVGGRQPDRFGVLARDFGIGDRVFRSIDVFDMDRMLLEHVDYGRVGPLLDAEKQRCLSVLRNAFLGGQDVQVRGEEHEVAKKSRPRRKAVRESVGVKTADRFKARLRREMLRVPEAGYLEYLGKIDKPDLKSTILVEIPSYKDPEVVQTVQSAIAMAANPERVRFAVCLQDDDPERLAELQGLPNVRIKHYKEANAPGTCAARYECQLLYDGEDFVFHTDAHMRFAKFWDVAMIHQWSLCGSEKAILTEYPVALRPEWLSEPVDSTVFTKGVEMSGFIVNAFYFGNGTCELRCRALSPFYGDKPRKGAFVAAGYSFGRPSMDLDVPFDPQMDFTGDESAMAPRFWTHGFDFFHPCVRFVYHLYATKSRPKAVMEVGSDGLTRSSRQTRRIEALLGRKDWPDVDLSGFGLGHERSLSDYEAFAGVNYRDLTVRNFAAKGYFDVAHENGDMEFFDWKTAEAEDFGRMTKPATNAPAVVAIPAEDGTMSGFWSDVLSGGKALHIEVAENGMVKFSWDGLDDEDSCYILQGIVAQLQFETILTTRKCSAVVPGLICRKYLGFRVVYGLDDSVGQGFVFLEAGQAVACRLPDYGFIDLVFLESYGGKTALSMQHDGLCDHYCVYDVTGGELVLTTDDFIVVTDKLVKGHVYVVEGYDVREGKYVLRFRSGETTCGDCFHRNQMGVGSPVLSVVVPVYNVVDYLPRCLDSLMACTMPDMEIILVDDGSTDGSYSVCEFYAAKYDFVRVTRTERASDGFPNVSEVRNTGVKLVRAPWMAFMDSDDTIHPYAYKKTYDAMIAHGCDIGVMQMAWRTAFGMHGTKIDPFEGDEQLVVCGLDDMLANEGWEKKYYCTIWHRIMRSDIVRKLYLPGPEYFPHKYISGEDAAYSPALYSYAEKFVIVRGAWYMWEGRHRTVTGSVADRNKGLEWWVWWDTSVYVHVWSMLACNPAARAGVDYNALCSLYDLYLKYKDAEHLRENIKFLLGVVSHVCRKFDLKSNRYIRKDQALVAFLDMSLREKPVEIRLNDRRVDG